MSGKERLGGAQAIVSGVLEEFRGLSARPHGSGQEAAETAYFMDRLRRLGLTPERDEAGNVRADVPPTPGHESAPLLILQGHMDMVCTAAPGSSFDPVRDTVTIVTEDGFLRSDGRSSLGADNNLGNAVVLYLLKEGGPHGPLRLLFTVSEEVGLQGAAQVDPKWLEGAVYLLNTDGFHLGLAVTGSAGGRRETYTHPLAWCAPQGTEGFRITLTGGLGGHSGDDIHRGRLNAVVALAQLLEDLSAQFPLEAANFTGGSGHNAIPGSAQATVVLPAGQGNALAAACAAAERDLLARHGAAEPDIRLTAAPISCPAQVWQAESRRAVCGLLTGLFCGVYAMHHAFPDVVGASANVGQVFMENSTAVVRAFIRCARPEEESILFPPARQHRPNARLCPYRSDLLPQLAGTGGQSSGAHAVSGVLGRDVPKHDGHGCPCGAGTLGTGGKEPGYGHGFHRAGYFGRPCGHRAGPSGGDSRLCRPAGGYIDRPVNGGRFAQPSLGVLCPRRAGTLRG